MLYCVGQACPLRDDCYRHTQPSPGRDRFAVPPYKADTGTCEFFVSNLPSEAAIRESAYYTWLREGRPGGRAEANWQQAFAMLCASTGRTPREE